MFRYRHAEAHGRSGLHAPRADADAAHGIAPFAVLLLSAGGQAFVATSRPPRRTHLPLPRMPIPVVFTGRSPSCRSLHEHPLPRRSYARALILQTGAHFMRMCCGHGRSRAPETGSWAFAPPTVRAAHPRDGAGRSCLGLGLLQVCRRFFSAPRRRSTSAWTIGPRTLASGSYPLLGFQLANASCLPHTRCRTCYGTICCGPGIPTACRPFSVFMRPMPG